METFFIIAAIVAVVLFFVYMADNEEGVIVTPERISSLQPPFAGINAAYTDDQEVDEETLPYSYLWK